MVNKMIEMSITNLDPIFSIAGVTYTQTDTHTHTQNDTLQSINPKKNTNINNKATSVCVLILL